MTLIDRAQVLAVHHWTDTLFGFTVTRAPSFRFVNGQFTMLGMEVGGAPLLRAYSLASADFDDTLEFLSIKVPDGPLTSRLQYVKPGDDLLVSRKATGTLLRDNLLPGKTLYLLATGTGVAPFLSIIKDPDIYLAHPQIVLFHGCRRRDELACGHCAVDAVRRHPLVGELAAAQLHYYPSVTREPSGATGRITDLVASGRLFHDLRLPPIDPDNSRVMLCGNPGMLVEMRHWLDTRGFVEGTSAAPGHYVVERAFVGR